MLVVDGSAAWPSVAGGLARRPQIGPPPARAAVPVGG